MEADKRLAISLPVYVCQNVCRAMQNLSHKAGAYFAGFAFNDREYSLLPYLEPSWRISISNKMAAARSPCGGFKTRVLHFKLRYTVKRQKMYSGSSKNAQFSFCFSSRNRPSRNSNLFSSRRSARSVLKCNQGEVFAEFSGTFCTLWPRNFVFQKKFMYI